MTNFIASAELWSSVKHYVKYAVDHRWIHVHTPGQVARIIADRYDVLTKSK